MIVTSTCLITGLFIEKVSSSVLLISCWKRREEKRKENIRERRKEEGYKKRGEEGRWKEIDSRIISILVFEDSRLDKEFVDLLLGKEGLR